MTEHATPEHGERAHAVLSASSAERWLACPGSVTLTRDLPDTTSSYAEWGTKCHELGELALRNKLLGEHVVIPQGVFDAEMFDAVAAYRGYVEGLIRRYGEGEEPIVMVEQRLNFSRWVPGGFGTGDLVLVFPIKRLALMVDLKGGQGIKVYAADNPQLKLYGAGTLELVDMICEVDEVILCIAQPRLDHFDEWAISTVDLLAWLAGIKDTAEDAYRGSTKLAAGDHCTFCKVKGPCPERKREALAAFEDHDVIPGLLTFEQIADLLPKLGRIKAWAEGLQQFAYDQAMSYGAKIPGYKLVAGRSSRKWADEGQVAVVMQESGLTEEEIWTKKLMGLTEAEKLLGKKHRVFELCSKSEGKPTLVPESDKRAEWNSQESVLAAFDD
jgi:hypothetical protein